MTSRASALGPPVDAPTAIRGRESAAARRGAEAGKDSATRFRPINRPNMAILASRACAPEGLPERPRTGVSTASRAPQPIASKTLPA